MKSFDCLELTSYSINDIVIKYLKIKLDHRSTIFSKKMVVFHLLPSFGQKIAKIVAWHHFQT